MDKKNNFLIFLRLNLSSINPIKYIKKIIMFKNIKLFKENILNSNFKFSFNMSSYKE